MFRKFLPLILLLAVMLIALPSAVGAAPTSAAPKCDQDVSVQKDD
jgi:hypothetical protein